MTTSTAYQPITIKPEMVCSYESAEDKETYYEWVGFPYGNPDSPQKFTLLVQEQDGAVYWSASIAYAYQNMADGSTMKHDRPQTIDMGQIDPGYDRIGLAHSVCLNKFVAAIATYFLRADFGNA